MNKFKTPGRLTALLLVVACTGPPGQATPPPPATKDAKMSEPPLLMESFDRSPPPKVDPVVRDGMRYVQHIGTHDDSVGQSGGLLDVIDDATGKLVATIKVYDNRRRPDVEGDVQDIFFASMAFDATGKLLITDEVGRRFAVDVTTRKATPRP